MRVKVISPTEVLVGFMVRPIKVGDRIQVKLKAGWVGATVRTVNEWGFTTFAGEDSVFVFRSWAKTDLWKPVLGAY